MNNDDLLRGILYPKSKLNPKLEKVKKPLKKIEKLLRKKKSKTQCRKDYRERRKERLKLATPSWANLEAINALYIEAEERSKREHTRYAVDHIIPLFHKYVCGLHVENNLRIISWKDNGVKNNKFTPG